jgi:ABC-type nitrate/sulfonate/bicarbonate transport system substrate-binding protein
MERTKVVVALLAAACVLTACSKTATSQPATSTSTVETSGTASTETTSGTANAGIPFFTLNKDKIYWHVTKNYKASDYPKAAMDGEPSQIHFFKPTHDEGVVNRDYPTYDKKTFKFLALPGGVIPPQDYYLFHKNGGTLKAALKGTGYKAVDIIDSGHVKILPNLYLGYYDFAWISFNVMTEYWSGNVSVDRQLWRGGNDYVIIGSSYDGGISLIAPPSVTSISQLANTNVGIMNPAFNIEALLNKKLTSVGLSTASSGGNVSIEMGMPGFVMNDLLAKKVKAVMAWGLYDKQLRQASGYKELIPWTEMGYGHKVPYYVLVVRKDILKKHPDIVQKVVQLNYDATKQAVKVGDYKKSDAVRYQHYWTYYMGNPNTGSRPTLVEPDASPNPTYLKDVISYMTKCGYFKTPYTYSQLVDLSFLKKVTK